MIIVILVILFILAVIALVVFRWRGSLKTSAETSRRFRHVGPGKPRDEPPRSTGIN